MMVLTRYLPRSTGVCADAAFAVTKAASIKIQRICMNALRCAPPEYRRPQRITALPRSVHTKIVLFVSESAAHTRTNKKGRPKPPFFKLCNRLPGSGGRRLLGRPLLHRPGVLAARIHVTVDELDHADRRAVAMAVARLEHARVAAATRGVARAEHVEQLLHHRRVAQLGERLAARMQVAALRKRHQLLDDRTQVLRLRQRGDDLLVLDQRRRKMLEQRGALVGAPVELAVGNPVTHREFPTLSPMRLRPRSAAGTRLNNDPRSAWRVLRCSRAASQALPCRDEDPSVPALP